MAALDHVMRHLIALVPCSPPHRQRPQCEHQMESGESDRACAVTIRAPSLYSAYTCMRRRIMSERREETIICKQWRGGETRWTQSALGRFLQRLSVAGSILIDENWWTMTTMRSLQREPCSVSALSWDVLSLSFCSLRMCLVLYSIYYYYSSTICLFATYLSIIIWYNKWPVICVECRRKYV